MIAASVPRALEDRALEDRALRDRNSWVRDERGYATLAATGVIVGLVFVLVMVMYVGTAVIARHRAQSAADLAALAAAADVVGVDGDRCARARWVVDAQPGVRLRRCESRGGGDVVVGVEVAVELGFFGVGSASAAARAGPVQ